MKQKTGNGCLKSAEAPIFTAGINKKKTKGCKHTHVNEIQRCAGTRAKCI